MTTKETQVEHFGIDFGTTNIAVGGLILDHDTKKAFRVLYGEDGVPFPSILALKDESGRNKIKFGRQVKTQIATLHDEGYQIIKSIKTALGEDIKYEIGSLRRTPTEIVQGLIESIKDYFAKAVKRKVDITEATVAVPVDFTSVQRNELYKAFRNAGIKVNKIISESMAAYIRNRDEVAGFSKVMVFDWGGGTLDISLLEVKKGKAYEIATSGWKVAGDRIDEIIAEFVHNQLLSEGKLSIKTSFSELSDYDKAKILTECERAKINFSDEYDIDEPAKITMVDYCGSKSVLYRLKYENFKSLIEQTVCDAVGLIGDVLKQANKVVQDLNAIIMVGGSSNLLPLRQIMDREFYHKKKIKIVYPDRPQWSVAEGAAIIDSIDCQYELNQDISVWMSDGTSYPIIKRGSKIPTDKLESVTFGTVDNATSANFIIIDDKENILYRLTMPAKGFWGETFDVYGEIDNSLTAKIVISGNKMMVGVKPQVAEINKLSYYCDISEIEDYKFEISND